MAARSCGRCPWESRSSLDPRTPACPLVRAAGRVGGFDLVGASGLRRARSPGGQEQAEVSAVGGAVAVEIARAGLAPRAEEQSEVRAVDLEVVVQVAFIEWTNHGKLRHPRLLGVRIDKAAAEVVRETPP